ncbi:hypothetical protein ACHQM5_028126 [Ranunculus cassubicifolius]
MEEYSSVSFWGDKVKALFTGKTRVPFDIILDIFTRLPAEYVIEFEHQRIPIRVFTTHPAFVEMHMKKSTPVIALLYLKENFVCEEAHVHLIDEVSKNVATKSFPRSKSGRFIFYGSYNGFLLFESKGTHVVIWNPSTGEKECRQTPGEGYLLCGFYFHPATKEYRVLFVSSDVVATRFCITSLWSNYVRFCEFNQAPSLGKSPTVLNGVLHWMVRDARKSVKDLLMSQCSNAILLFDINSEVFSCMPHPGGQCDVGTHHDNMELMEMEGQLCLCDSSSVKNLVIWMLDDYANRIWVRKHDILINPLLKFCGLKYGSGFQVDVGGFYMCNKELLLRVSCSDLILYNLELNTPRRAGEFVGKDKRKNMSVVAVPHVNTVKKLKQKYNV